jgi:hypothetical protein
MITLFVTDPAVLLFVAWQGFAIGMMWGHRRCERADTDSRREDSF